MKRKEDPELFDRPMPRDLHAEQSVLGSILLDPSVMVAVKQIVVPDDFLSDANRAIFAAMSDMEAVDVLLLASKLKTSGKLDSVGGTAYLTEIVQVTPVAHHVVHYAKIVAECARKRKLIELCVKALKVLYGERHTAAEVADRMKTALDRYRD